MEENKEKTEWDLTIVYDYKQFPDKISGRCDNCGKTHFHSSVKDNIFLRECANCGLKKSI